MGLKPKEYPQLVMLGIGSNRVMMQRNYPISDESVDDAYASIEKNIDIVSAEMERIYPEYNRRLMSIAKSFKRWMRN